MKQKIRSVLVRKDKSKKAANSLLKSDIDRTEVRFAAARSKKAIMELAERTNHILIVEED